MPETEPSQAERCRILPSHSPWETRAREPALRTLPGNEPIRDPLLAGAASLVFPGTGQFYNGKTARGVGLWSGLVVSVAVLSAIPSPIPTGAFCFLGIWGWGIIDAYVTAGEINAGHTGFEGSSPLMWAPAVLGVSAVTALVLAGIAQALVS